MLKKLLEEDFSVLKGPLESGRQSPSSLGGVLLLAIFLQILMYYLTYHIATRSTIYPNIQAINKVHFWITVVLILLSALYSIPVVYKKSQKIQYLVSVLVSQNLFGVYLYIPALFLVGEGEGVTKKSLYVFTYVTLGFGVLIFFATCVRFYILLKKGSYRKGSKKDKLRNNIEKMLPSYLPMIIIGSTGLVFVIQYLVRVFGLEDIETAGMIVLGISIFFTMLFVLPEQLVILYCKCRFKSFNFDSNGYLLSKDESGKNLKV